MNPLKHFGIKTDYISNNASKYPQPGDIVKCPDCESPYRDFGDSFTEESKRPPPCSTCGGSSFIKKRYGVAIRKGGWNKL